MEGYAITKRNAEKPAILAVDDKPELLAAISDMLKDGISIMLDAMYDIGIYTEQISDWDTKLLLQSSQLHDVGKIAVSDAILNKPGKLTSEEFAEMKNHTVLGVQIIEKIEASTPKFLRECTMKNGMAQVIRHWAHTLLCDCSSCNMKSISFPDCLICFLCYIYFLSPAISQE